MKLTNYFRNTMNTLQQLMTVLSVALLAACTPKEKPFRTALEMRDAVKVGWNLGNSLEAFDDQSSGLDTELAWFNPRTTKVMIDSVKAAGFNAIRVPIRWEPHFQMEEGKLVVDPAWMSRVQEVVDWCMEDDLITIINTHHDHWLESHPFYADSTEVLDKERQLWTLISDHFKEYDDRLLFAGTNEVHLMGQWGPASDEQGDMQNVFNQTFVNTVRATGGNNRNRNLIVQTYYCAPVHNAKLFVAPKDVVENHLMIDIHLYEPSTYAMLGIERYWGAEYLDDIKKDEIHVPERQMVGPDQIRAYLDGKFNNPETDEQRMDKLLEGVKVSLDQWGLPLVLSECGASRWCELDAPAQDRVLLSRAYYSEYLIRAARRCGMAPFLWDNGSLGIGTEHFGLFDRNDNMKPDRQTIDGIMRGAEEPYGE